MNRPFLITAAVGCAAGVALLTLTALAARSERVRSPNFVVIFTSDNGPWLEWGEHGGAAAPFRGGIGTTLEGGVRVPCLMRWPGVIPPASTCRAVASVMDFLPTFAKLAGARPPQDRVIDGHDIGPLLRDPNSTSPYEFFLHYSGRQRRTAMTCIGCGM